MSSLNSVLWSRRAVLSLYRSLLREGDKLKYTDQEFFRSAIRKEFEKAKKEDHHETKQKLLDVSVHFPSATVQGLFWNVSIGFLVTVSCNAQCFLFPFLVILDFAAILMTTVPCDCNR